jgi:PhnB protein
MAGNVKPIPEGYGTVTPYLTVDDAAAQIEFLQKAFNAQLTYSHKGPDGKIGHAELRIGNSQIMLGQARGEWKARPATFYLYVEDCDALYKNALAVGAKSLQEPKDQFYGDRSGGVEDSNGNYWWIGTHVEDVPPEEIERRAAAAGRA